MSAASPCAADKTWQLRLYVAGMTATAERAVANLTRICQEHLDDDYHVEIVDLFDHPELAETDQIIAVPTLVRRMPQPLRKIIGDLSNTKRVLVGLAVGGAL